MKAFSKEWWLKLAEQVNKDYEKYYQDDRVGLKFPKTWTWHSGELRVFLDYCYKRYAEAYHREKVKQENPLEISLSEVGIGFNKLGQKEERERILGIINEEIGIVVGMNHEEENYEAGRVHALAELIEKIKE